MFSSDSSSSRCGDDMHNAMSRVSSSRLQENVFSSVGSSSRCVDDMHNAM